MILPIAIVAQAEVMSLDALRWKRRVVIVFAPIQGDAGLERQRRMLEGTALAERGVQIVEVVGDTVSGAREDADRLRQRFGIAPDQFQALLIGKDGGVKLRSTEAIPMQRLSATIDTMPMRRREIDTR